MKRNSAVRFLIHSRYQSEIDVFALTKRLVASGLSLAAAASLLGCARSTPSGELAPDISDNQRVLRSEASKFNETVAVPAVIGGVGGGVLGRILCDKKRAGCIAKGAAVGALLGGGAGYLVALQNEKFANRESELKARSDAARAEAERFDEVINATNNVIIEHKREINSLNKRYRAGEVSRDDYQKRVAAVNDDIEAVKATISSNQKDIDAINEDLKRLGRNGTGELAAERDRLLNQKRTLGKNEQTGKNRHEAKDDMLFSQSNG